jgi:dihydroxy-acid dehydratase
MLAVTGAIRGPAWADVLLITDGRFSGATWGACVDHVAPRRSSAAHRPVAEGDTISIDVAARRLDLGRPGRAGPPPRPGAAEALTPVALAKYVMLVGGADQAPSAAREEVGA